MPEPFVAGTFTSEPVRIHSYDSRGVFMPVNADNQGCWGDPYGRVVLPSLDIVDRVLKAHGYVRDEMVVRRVERGENDEVAPASPSASVEDPVVESVPDGSEGEEDPGKMATDDSFASLESSEPPKPAPPKPTKKGRR